MIILLDTSTPICRLYMVDGDSLTEKDWEAGRTLALGLLAFLKEQLAEAGSDLRSIQAIGVMRGPGSFTGLRIGLAVLNTLADTLQVPIVGATGEAWRTEALDRLRAGENDQIALPFYGGEANITAPRK